MRILVLTQFYPPETGAAQNRLSDLALRLNAAGHAVTVLTAMPNHPAGRILNEYRGRWFMSERAGNVRILRGWCYATPNKGFGQRLLNHLSFAFTSLTWGLLRSGPQDIVLTQSPPLFVGLSGWLLAACRRARFFFNVSDLWPESAVSLGVLRNPMLIKASTLLEEFCYARADLIIGQTQGIVDSIHGRFPAKPVHLMANGVDPSDFPPGLRGAPRSKARSELGFGDDFVVGYAGLHGLAQGLTTLLEAAQLLKDQADIRFVLLGDGPEKPRLIQIANSLQLTNVCFFASRPRREIPAILAAFDAVAVPLRKLDLFRGALPSKLFEAMAAGTPVVLSVQGEAEQVLRQAGAGICVEPEDPQALAQAVRALYNDRSRTAHMGENARSYVCLHYNRAEITAVFERLALSILSHDPRITDPSPAVGGNPDPWPGDDAVSVSGKPSSREMREKT